MTHTSILLNLYSVLFHHTLLYGSNSLFSTLLYSTLLFHSFYSNLIFFVNIFSSLDISYRPLSFHIFSCPLLSRLLFLYLHLSSIHFSSLLFAYIMTLPLRMERWRKEAVRMTLTMPIRKKEITTFLLVLVPASIQTLLWPIGMSWCAKKIPR